MNDLAARYNQLADFKIVEDGAPNAAFPFSYYQFNLCPDRNTRSDYIVDESDGFYRINVCGKRRSGSLTFVERATIAVDDLFGTVSGWIYNGPKSAFFFGEEGHDLGLGGPLAYPIVEGKRHTAGTAFVFGPGDVGVSMRN